MRNILYISSSPRHSESYSKQVAQDVIDDLRGAGAGVSRQKHLRRSNMSPSAKARCGENRIDWDRRDPSIAEMLADPIVQAVMAADRVDANLLGSELKSLVRNRADSG